MNVTYDDVVAALHGATEHVCMVSLDDCLRSWEPAADAVMPLLAQVHALAVLDAFVDVVEHARDMANQINTTNPYMEPTDA
jgi:hypothetical protein